MPDTTKHHRMVMTLIALGLILYGYKIAAAPRELYSTFCIAVLSATGLFKAADFLASRRNKEPPA
jgi:hypothetical protein